MNITTIHLATNYFPQNQTCLFYEDFVIKKQLINIPCRRRFKDVQIFDGERRHEDGLLPMNRFKGFDDRREEEGSLEAELRQVVVDGAEASGTKMIFIDFYHQLHLAAK